MGRVPPIMLLVLACLASSRIADAQDFRAYVGGTFAISPWLPHAVSGGTPSTSYGNSSPQHTTSRIVGEAGWFFNRWGAIGVEVDIPLQRNVVNQSYGYLAGGGYLRTSRYREVATLVVLRAQEPEAARFRVSIVGGGGVLHASSLERTATPILPFGPNDFGPLGSEKARGHTALAAIAGAGLAIRTTRHLSAIAEFRVLFVARGDLSRPGTSLADLGLNRAVYRGAIGLRVRF